MLCHIAINVYDAFALRVCYYKYKLCLIAINVYGAFALRVCYYHCIRYVIMKLILAYFIFCELGVIPHP